MSFEIHSLIVSFIKYVFRTYCRAPDPKNVYILIFRICEYVRLHGKGEFRLHLELRLLIKWPWDEKVILEYLLKDNVITRVFISGRGGEGREPERWQLEKVLTQSCGPWWLTNGAICQVMQWPWEEDKETGSIPGCPEGMQPW